MKKILLLAVAALVIGCSGNKRSGLLPDGYEMGIQMYTLRTMIGSAQLYEANHERVIDSLKAFGSTIEEARADLFALYYLPDAGDIGVYPRYP